MTQTERPRRHPGLRWATAGLVTAWLLAPAGPASAQQAVTSPHGALPRGLDCSACHTAEGWQTLRRPLAFDHGAGAGFALSGAHAQAPCAECHLDLRFDEPRVRGDDCGSCHADVHEGRMIQECAACHTTRSFLDVDGEVIHARTSFPLTGAHRQISCESCHTTDVGGAFTSLDADCVSCHEAAYRQAQTVDHVASGYPTDCAACHTTLGWSDSPAFDHLTISGGFALIGAHARLRCASCHEVPGMQPRFNATSENDCVACHQADYDREHGGTGMPTDCATCHSPTAWRPSTFDHDGLYFPIFSGAHQSVWSSCATCHTTPGDLSAFSCTVCHQQGETDGHHTEVAGYAYESGACYSCHPRGRH